MSADADTPVLETRADPKSADYQENVRHHEKLLADLEGKLERVRAGGSEKAVALHKKRGKLTARERVAALVDPDTDFLELSALAALGMYDDEVPAAGIVTGLGVVAGRLCVVAANDATVKGGTYYPETIRKHLRAQEIALENRLPCVYLVDSGGVFLPKQSEVFPDKEHFGRIFYNQAVMSAAGIPQVSVVMGMCTAGGAYVPAMSDECVIVRGNGTIYLGGPPLVKAATGEESSAEELGGGEMHSRTSGVTDHLAENDEDALRICRSIVANLNAPAFEAGAGEAPLYPADDLYSVVHRDLRRPCDPREVIARLVDGSRFHEFKALY
ncbi:MAG: methylcrotonoyl-CoA carboxylase, partial [Elusimicrobia bacterium]|nr:methylcrotonoyl-CoA carboxylase [Elusimicrobiota bacterium]